MFLHMGIEGQYNLFPLCHCVGNCRELHAVVSRLFLSLETADVVGTAAIVELLQTCACCNCCKSARPYSLARAVAQISKPGLGKRHKASASCTIKPITHAGAFGCCGAPFPLPFYRLTFIILHRLATENNVNRIQIVISHQRWLVAAKPAPTKIKPSQTNERKFGSSRSSLNGRCSWLACQ